MSENYLLNNATARKLYFDAVKDLPTLSLVPFSDIHDARYDNIARAFLLSDTEKLELMRRCSVDEKYISGCSSDFEKLRTFCEILPSAVGNPIYLLSHIELRMLWECDLPINPATSLEIWRTLNDRIAYLGISEIELLKKANAERVPYLTLDTKRLAGAGSLDMLEGAIRADVERGGCGAVLVQAPQDMTHPNPYLVGEILKKASRGEEITQVEWAMLEIQIARIAGTICCERDLCLLICEGENSENLLKYLDASHVLPRRHATLCFFDIGDSEEHLARQIRELMRRGAIGKALITTHGTGYARDIARADYLRREICTVLGEIYEREEYLDTYESLAALARNIFYNNIKEIIL